MRKLLYMYVCRYCVIHVNMRIIIALGAYKQYKRTKCNSRPNDKPYNTATI